MRRWRRWWELRARSAVRSLGAWLFVRLAERREIRGVPVLVLCEDADALFDKLEAAFELLEFYGRRTLAGLQQDTNGVWVSDVAPGIAQWRRDRRLVEVDEDYARAPETSPRQIAATLVHEVTHARLERMGFAYLPERRERIEKACFRRELAFARRLPPGAEDLIAEAESQLARPPDYLTPEWRRAQLLEKNQQRLARLRELGVPRWIVGALGRLSRRRLSPQRAASPRSSASLAASAGKNASTRSSSVVTSSGVPNVVIIENSARR